ncbi:glycosyltransferase family 39 protein [Acidipila sp. 4G-K13]|nr:glycosyltransferase family 39 protein [Paracidobacterium acidisoli]
MRMLYGEVVYRDFFQFTPPGTDLIFLAVFRIFGLHAWVFGFVVILIGALLCWICLSISRQIMDAPSALLAMSLFLVFVFGKTLGATHHWFSLFAALCAVRVLMRARTSAGAAFAGVLLAIASFFTQTTGAVVLIAVLLFLAWDESSLPSKWPAVLKLQSLLLFTFCVTLFILNAWFIWKAGWRQIWYCQVTFPAHYVEYGRHMLFPGLHRQDGGGVSLRNVLDLARRLLLYLLPFVVYPLIGWQALRRRQDQAGGVRRSVILCAFAGAALWLEMITRSNWVRISVIAMPAIILLVWAGTRKAGIRRCLLGTGWVLVLACAIAHIWSRQHQNLCVTQLPIGKVLLPPPEHEKLSLLAQDTKPGEYFFQAMWLNVYPALMLRSPAFVDELWASETTRPEYAERTLQQLQQRQVTYILWSPRLNSPMNPARPWEYHLNAIHAWLRSHYRLIHIFSDQDELWQKN